MTPTSSEQYLNQKGQVIWMIGLSGSGKTTIALALSEILSKQGYYHIILDGDVMRQGLCQDLGFTVEDRRENIRRVAEVAKILSDNGAIVICPLITPTVSDRALAKAIIGDDNFNLVYINTPLEVCELRDVKGLYKKARNGEIKNFTGISSPFEEPEKAFVYETIKKRPSEISNHILENLVRKQYVKL